MAAESHPFPSRTRPLSPPAPMVLGGRPPGRVGRRRIALGGAPSPRWGRSFAFQRLSRRRRPGFEGTPAELRQTRATCQPRCGRTSPTAIELAMTVRALREPVERSRVVGSAPRSGRRAPPVACRCAGSPTSSLVAPPGRRLPSGPIGGRRAVELHRRPPRRQWPGWRRASARGPRARVARAPERRGRAGPGPAHQARAARGRAGPGPAHQAQAAAAGGPDQLAGSGGRGRPTPGSSRSGGPRSGSRRTSSDGRTRSGSSAGGRSGSAGRTSRVRDLATAARSSSDRRRDASRTAAPVRGGTVATPVGEMAPVRTAPAEPAQGRVPEVVAPAHAPTARRVRGSSGAPGALVALGVRRAAARTGARTPVALARRPGRRPPAAIGDGREPTGPRRRASVARRPAVGVVEAARARAGARASCCPAARRPARPRSRRPTGARSRSGSTRDRSARRRRGRPSGRRPRPRAGTRRRRRLPDDVVAELERAAGTDPSATPGSASAGGPRRLRGRAVPDAVAILGPLATEVPGAAAVRELNGLTCYRLGRWKKAHGRARGLPPPDRRGRSAPGPGRLLPRPAALVGRSTSCGRAPRGVAVGRAGDGGPHRGRRRPRRPRPADRDAIELMSTAAPRASAGPGPPPAGVVRAGRPLRPGRRLRRARRPTSGGSSATSPGFADACRSAWPDWATSATGSLSHPSTTVATTLPRAMAKATDRPPRAGAPA